VRGRGHLKHGGVGFAKAQRIVQYPSAGGAVAHVVHARIEEVEPLVLGMETSALPKVLAVSTSFNDVCRAKEVRRWVVMVLERQLVRVDGPVGEEGIRVRD